MKKILEFKINKIVKEKREEIVKDEAGVEIKKEIEIIKKVPSTFFVKKPTRSMFDDAELYYGVKLGDAVKAGMLTRSMLAKRFNNDGGVFSDPEMGDLKDKYKRLLELTTDYQFLSNKADKTEDETKKFESIKIEFTSLQREIQKMELDRESLYDRTADSRAKNKLLSWWTVNLCYEVDDSGKEKPFFKGDNIEAKLDHYEEIAESGDDIKKLALKKFLYYISFWNSTGATEKDEFDKAVTNLKKTSEENDGEYEDLIEALTKDEV